MSRIRADQLVNRAGSGGPKFPNGVAEGFSVSGVVTATSFRGDGSQLSGVDASTLKNGNDVKVQATATGATVTGTLVADVSGNITSSGANTLGSLTVSNDATVQGNLTVNGTTTTIDTAVTSVDSLAVDGSVGVGTTNPRTDLQVGAFGGGDSNIQLATGTSGASNILFGDGSGGSDYYKGFIKYNHSTDNLELHTTDDLIHHTGGTERFRITSDGHILPGADNTQDLGSSSKRFANLYTGDLNLSNEGSTNDVDGTWGSYVIQEGEDDLFLINRRTGKKYKFNLTEV